ncbi:hypothetical protein H6790_02160 [Candidatus Nomurabacteria bacterium]|nr:hypothetical protein [Candidatus Nomurabacteria bacterium]
MENEKHFYPTSESNEQPTREYSVNFLSSSHPDAEQAERTYDTQKLVGMMNRWWKQICAENNIDPNDKKFNNLDYYIFELGKNALEHGRGGEIKVIFEEGKITVIITSYKNWTGNPSDDILYGTPGYGLSQTKEFADEFMIETNGKKYTKVKGQDELNEVENSDFNQGTKITFIKNFE